MRVDPRSGTSKRCLIFTVVAALTVSCADNSWRYNRTKAQATLRKLETPGLVLGEFSLASDAVLDGDTIRVEGLESSLRLLGLDTEEIYHHKDNKRAAEIDFDKYMRDQRGDSPRPVKFGTPVGVEAKQFAIDFLDGADTVRIERDHPKEIRGFFNRYLAYVFVKKNGKWVNYNVECVRAGMSPYFTKYGYSRRFHDQFVQAEKEARAAHRGIWDPNKQHYPDYAERKAWWNARGDFLRKFEAEARGRDDYVVLTNWDSLRRIQDHVGKQITVLGLVDKVKLGDRGPTRVLLSRRVFSNFPVIFFDKDVFLSSGIARYKREFVTVTGFVTEYTNKRRKRTELQIVVDVPGQVSGSNVPGIAGTTPRAAMEQ
ncbi:MAG TPA: thermonuclease family protein [Kofleriaceae bacterium]|nr:thermonuclease family protein [Kofleriaceae bacterium]